MTEWASVSTICLARTCHLVYRSADGLIGLAITSSSGRKDRRRYFVWDLPGSAPDYATEAEARAVVVSPRPPAKRRRHRA